MNDYKNKIDMLWDDNPIDVTAEANFIWSIANKLRGTYMPDKYGDVIIPIPPIKEQAEIADYLDDKCSKIESIIEDKKAQLETIENYKKSLIYEYVTGKKEVPTSD